LVGALFSLTPALAVLLLLLLLLTMMSGVTSSSASKRAVVCLAKISPCFSHQSDAFTTNASETSKRPDPGYSNLQNAPKGFDVASAGVSANLPSFII
jgi:hypothetical protein